MREIKFRAWIKERFRTNLIDPLAIRGIKAHMSEVFTLSDFDKNYLIPEACYIEDMEIMQWIGLVDRNGEEIYEGDIVTVDSRHQWPKGKTSMRADLLAKRPLVPIVVEYKVWQDDEGYEYLGYENYIAAEIQVIGNIHENPELLK